MRLWKRKPLAAIPKHDLKLLQARVGMLATDDPLWPMLKALVRRNIETETEAVAREGIGNEEAHRGRGRVGMLLEIETQLQKVWEDSHARE